MKKLVNDPHRVVREMLEGLCDMHPGLALLQAEDVVVRAGLPPSAERPVAILSGGGAGHEPAHAGYVGPGLLAGAIVGDVFTSPSVDAVLAGIRAAAGPAGAVLVMKNYTGDRLNFGLAAELARAEGIPVEVVVVADDVALHATVPPDRRRGIAGTVLIHKLAGAAAAAGQSMAAVADLARAAAAELGSMGVALGACTIPAAGRPGFEIGPAEIELGLGIHGEQGVERTALRPADQLVERLLGTILADRGLLPGEPVALLVNGLGGTPPMELAILARRAIAFLREQGLVVERAWAGEFLTALEMPGASLSVLRLDAVAAALDTAEPELTQLDSRAGDGDLGISMRRAAAALRALPEVALADPPTALAVMAEALRRAIGGSSGPFYATALMRAARHLPASPAPADWAKAFDAAVAAIGELGGARAGDRTMLDALLPATTALTQKVGAGAGVTAAARDAAAAAEAGSAATAGMLPRPGRASYLGARAVGGQDAGATAVAIWLRALAG